jgi:uncharacterized protein (DUF1800 family)
VLPLWAAAGAALALPGIDAPMDEALARSMLNRFGFGVTPASLAQATGMTQRQYLQRAIGAGSTLPSSTADALNRLPVSEPVDEIWKRLGPGGYERARAVDAESRQQLQQTERQYLTAAVQARLLVMANGDNPGHEALLAFWLNHFSVFAPKGEVKLVAWDYVQALDRALRSDSFEELLRASFYSPAMQLYLDNAQSTAPDSAAARMAARHGKDLGINENLARELLELHTLGVGGGYTQADVQALARIITGAGVYSPRMQERNLARAAAVRTGLFLFDPRRHDAGEKRFLGEFFPAGRGLGEIDRALHLMAIHPATARHIATKLARRFLADDPPQAVVDAMSAAFLASGGRISSTLWPLLQSPEFAASLTQGRKFKEPADYVLSVARAACGDQPINNARLLAATLTDMGEAPLMHTTPDGYGARESDWLSPAAMAKRVRLALGVAAGRVPLAAAEDAGGPNPPSGRDAGMERRRPLQGTACALDGPALERAVGPVSSATQAAASALSPRERAGLLLASPDFMRR